MTIFDDTDRITRPRLTVVEIAAIANSIAKARIRIEKDIPVRATAVRPKLIDQIPTAPGDIDHDALVDRPLIATNIGLTGVKYEGVDVAFPPTIIIIDDGSMVTGTAPGMSARP